MSLELIPISNCVELLIQWDFSEEVQLKFLNEDVTLEDFLNMGLTRLQEFVSDNSERLRLIQCILKYKVRNQQSQSSSPAKEDDREIEPKDPDYIPEETGSDSDDDDNDLSPQRKKLCIRETGKGSHSVPELLNDSSSEKQDTRSTPSSSGKQDTQSTPRRLQAILNKNKFMDLTSSPDLKALLESDILTKCVFHDNVNGVLTNSNRKILKNALSEYMLRQTERPSEQDFLAVREKIYEVFPNEPQGLYYQAPRESGVYQTLARGILFNAVRNKIGKLIATKVLTPNRRKNAEQSDQAASSEGQPLLSANVQAALSVLKRCREVTPDVSEKWKVSAEYRLKSLYGEQRKCRKPAAKSSKNDKTPPEEENKSKVLIGQYLNDFKVLKSPLGYQLLLFDFEHLYQEQAQSLICSWPEVRKKIERLALHSRESVKDPVGIELAKLLKGEEGRLLDEDSTDAVCMQLLPSLCTPSARVTVGTRTFKPSVLESRDAFISYTATGAEVEALIEKRRTLMAEVKGPIQPYMIFQGPTRAEIVAAYVVLDRVLYKLNSVVECVDVCFKVFHALCVGYPKEANHLWHFFHLFIFKIKHNPALEGQVPISTQSFIAAVKSFEETSVAA